MTSQKQWSELGLIELLADKSKGVSAEGVITGIGDDCAVFKNRCGRNWLATTDILIEGVHFDLSWHPPHLLGRKAVAVNLSDIAAMGGTPHYALISIGVSDQVDNEFLSRFSGGAAEILNRFDCSLIGGDTARAPALTINVVILGTTAEDCAILRSGSVPGENIYVSGPLGSAAVGLEISRRGLPPGPFAENDVRSLVDKHLNPEPRVELGRLLGTSKLVSAMQDISDGLATDLAHICRQSGVGAEISAELLPGHELLKPLCRLLKLDSAAVQTTGGDDYELLFTVKRGKDEEVHDLLGSSGFGKIHRIGRTIEGTGVNLIDGQGSTDISFMGYQHAGGK